MRKTLLGIAALGLMFPASAWAGHCCQTTSVKANYEQGVKVYRGTPLAHRPAPVVVRQAPQADISAQRLALQNQRLAAQSERIDGLESRLEEANRPKRRPRYGTTYFDSPFLFGNNRSFGGRGTMGSSRRGLRSRRGIRRR